MFESAASAVGEIIDIAGNLVGHHQRQVGMRTFQFGFGLGFDILVDGGRQFIGFVDRRRLGLLLGESVALLEGGGFEAIDAVEDAVQFLLQTVVRFEVESIAQELVKGGVEIELCGFKVTRLVVVLAGLVFLLYPCDQVGYGINFQGLWNLRLRLRFGSVRLRLMWIRRVAGRCDQRRCLSLRGRQEGRFLGGLAADGGS